MQSPSLEVFKTYRCDATVPGSVVGLAVLRVIGPGDPKGLLQQNSVVILGMYYYTMFQKHEVLALTGHCLAVKSHR